VIGVVPYVGLNFGVYETLKAMLLIHYGMRDERELSVPARLACGAAAGTMGQTVAYPFDVARRRLQVCVWWGLGGRVKGILQHSGMHQWTAWVGQWHTAVRAAGACVLVVGGSVWLVDVHSAGAAAALCETDTGIPLDPSNVSCRCCCCCCRCCWCCAGVRLAGCS
jgi:hypothetical protein